MPGLAAAAEPALGVTEGPDGSVRLVAHGVLDAATVGGSWLAVQRAATARAAGRRLVIDLTDATTCDTAAATLLLDIARQHQGDVDWQGAAARITVLLDRLRHTAEPRPAPPAGPVPTWRELIVASLASLGGGIAYLGEATVAVVRLPARARLFRRADLMRTADAAGVRAVPLALLLGVLIGVILAFQSLIPMRRFGADIYVANLVAASLVRELGPLLAAVILAGRTGSAFAAELGTMKVNQEIDALATMDIDPMTMLVLPRLAAAMLVMPALTVILEVAGLAGMTLVLVGAGLPPVTIANQVESWVTPTDFLGGMVKAMTFGAAVAAIGCRAGLATGVGPRAVGLAATAAVVGGIVATIVLDGLFAVVFYRLGV